MVSYGLGNEIGLFLWLVAGGAGLSGLLAANRVHTPCSQRSEPPSAFRASLVAIAA